jgi:hypothetical protein
MPVLMFHCGFLTMLLLCFERRQRSRKREEPIRGERRNGHQGGDMSQAPWRVRSMVAAFTVARRHLRRRMFVGLHRALTAGFISLAVLSFAPCAAAQGAPSSSDSGVPNASGFLQDYARLKPFREVKAHLAALQPFDNGPPLR